MEIGEYQTTHENRGISKNMSKITVKTKIIGSKILYEYDVEGECAEVFNIDGNDSWFGIVSGGVHEFFIEYDENVESVPESIAVIPFLCNVLPIAWMYDAEIIVPELDEDFFESIPGFKRGYEGMYRNVDLKGRVTPGRLVKNELPENAKGSLVFFSGGVDAHFTLLSKIHEKPLAVTLWGSDIYFKQTAEWTTTANQNFETARSLGLSYASIKTSFRLFLKYSVLDAKFAKPNGTSWWYGFQHSIGIISHAAPLAWKRGIRQVYIASTFSIFDDPTTKCASWPTIDNFVRFFDCLVDHHDFKFTRQDKIKEICRISEELNIPISLRVCWQSGKAQNCCRCEKCVRTLFGVLAENKDPMNYGFNVNDDVYANIEQLITSGKIKPTKFWGEIVKKLRINDTLMETASHVRTLVSEYDSATQNKPKAIG
ncbi:hypothetical protein FOB32_22670 [Burkholderia multivorans]|nr:hypothetical protein FOB32_22670 [Burkholderia multivorans]